jgi:hypothetical protein
MGIRNSFFEWMRLWFLKIGENKKLRITGSDSMKHPSGDIDFVKEEENEVVLALNEMSLLGTDSPLPDSLVREVNTDFLNTLQHHLAMLRFSALFEKSNFLMQELGNLKWQNRFALYNEKFSPEMLRRFFVKMFPGCKISVHCFEPLQIENPAPIFLGSANLNGAGLLGKRCTSLTSAMRLDVCGIRKKEFLNVKFPFKIKVKFKSEASGEICVLGKQKLSENFWLGSKNFEPLKLEKSI